MTARPVRGRPLRFLGLAGASWIGVRTFFLWPHITSPSDMWHVIAPDALAHSYSSMAGFGVNAAPPLRNRADPDAYRSADARAHPTQVMRHADTPWMPRAPTRLAPFASVRYGNPWPVDGTVPILPGLPPVFARDPSPRLSSRWSGSFWLIARGAPALAPGTFGGQLGGSQAGVRLSYLVDRKHRIALAARVTTPLGKGLREAALGVEWRPTRLPVMLVAEQRIALNGDKSGPGIGPGIGIVGGFGPVAIPLGFRLEGYGQAGAIHRRAIEAYADGALRLAHALATLGPARIDLGAGAWGAAQRDAARLDIGPSLGVTLPVGKQAVRVALDWRQRVAGAANPLSGPAFTLGTDF